MRILLAVILCTFACGSGGSQGDDDDPPSDGPPGGTDTMPPDSPPMNVDGIGTTCTPDAMNPQGTCPVGFECLNLQGATNPWCSKTCQTGAGDACATGYTGPGKAACILQVTPLGGAAVNYCAVICQDTTQEMQFCPECNGTCPGAMACTQPIQNTGQGGGTLGNACQ